MVWCDLVWCGEVWCGVCYKEWYQPQQPGRPHPSRRRAVSSCRADRGVRGCGMELVGVPP